MDTWYSMHTENFSVPTYHVDAQRRMTLPSLLLLLQEMAWKHANLHGFGYRHLQARGLFWVLSRISLRVYRFPQWEDTLRINTWATEPDVLTAYRDFEGFDLSHDKLFAATSDWHILSWAHNRPQPMEDFKKYFSLLRTHALKEPAMKIPTCPQPQKSALRAVVPSDIDMHQHVNNTQYVRWVLDSFPLDFLSRYRVTQLDVNFLLQSKVGDQFHIATGALSDTEYISSVMRKDDKKELARIHTLWTENE
jgi:acyl-ACP thioesterase